MFVYNPDPYSLPTYRIGPFTTNDVARNHNLFKNEDISTQLINNYFIERFGENIEYTSNGREGINIALDSYNLSKDDLVTILTTSQNFYISSCVTKEVEKYCRWNREIVPETKILFVNHEFGYCYPYMDSLVSLDLPIIEDCCTTFFSQNKKNKIGKYGDFAIYSFPKFFPIQIGGLLVNNKKKPSVNNSIANSETIKYIKKVLSYYLGQHDTILSKRKELFDFTINYLRKLGFSERFESDIYTVPSAMMLNNNGIIKDLPALKIFLWNHGIQSSIFYGEDAFFIPNHQNLTETDISYFASVLKYFKEN